MRTGPVHLLRSMQNCLDRILEHQWAKQLENSKPLMRWCFSVIAASVNVVTDILFVVVFQLEAAGTAIATVLSQIGSCAAAFVFLYKKREHFGFELKLRFLKIRGYAAKTIIRLAIPQIARTLLVRFSMLYVTVSCNAYGASLCRQTALATRSRSSWKSLCRESTLPPPL